MRSGLFAVIERSQVAPSAGRGWGSKAGLFASGHMCLTWLRLGVALSDTPCAGRRTCSSCIPRCMPARPGRRVVYLVAIAVAFLSPLASFAIDAVVAVYFAVSRSAVPGLIVQSTPVDGARYPD